LKAFERALPRAARGEVEGVHQARVASRRLREVLPLLAETAEAETLDQLRLGLREITRCLGPVREIDVALADLAELEPTAPDHVVAIAAVRQAARLEREGAVGDIEHALADVQPHILARQVRQLARQINSPSARVRCAMIAAGQLQERATDLQTAVATAGSIYAAGPLHEVRIALKKFRYALEVVAALGRLRPKKTLGDMKALQEVLGHLHDLYVLSARVRDAGAAAHAPRHRKPLEAFATDIDDRVRQLHSRYLAERDILVPVLRQARRAGGRLGS